MTKLDVFIGARFALVGLSLFVAFLFAHYAHKALCAFIHREPSEDRWNLSLGVAITSISVALGNLATFISLFGRGRPPPDPAIWAMFAFQVGLGLIGYSLHIVSMGMARAGDDPKKRKAAVNKMWVVAILFFTALVAAAAANSLARG